MFNTSPETRQGVIPSLDGVRGIAVLLVIFGHTTPILFPGGRAGVDLFFVLSGFLITGILVREKLSTGSISLTRFYARRLLRLYPALLLLIACVLIYSTFQGSQQLDTSLSNAWAVITYHFNWQLIWRFDQYASQQWMFLHLWSLSIEEQYYLLWPISLALLPGGRKLKQLTLLIAIAGIILPELIRINLWHASGSQTLYFRTDLRIDGFMWGALVALMTLRTPSFGPSPRFLIGLAGLVGLSGILWLASFDGLSTGFVFTHGQSLAGIFSASLIYSTVVAPARILTMLLESPLLRWVGTISYGLYLWHWPIIRLFTMVDLPPYLSTFLGVLVTTSVAGLSYFLVERRFWNRNQRN